MVDDGVIKPLGELVGSQRYARDLTHLNRVTYTKRWWGPHKAEPINAPFASAVADAALLGMGACRVDGHGSVEHIPIMQLKLDLE